MVCMELWGVSPSFAARLVQLGVLEHLEGSAECVSRRAGLAAGKVYHRTGFCVRVSASAACAVHSLLTCTGYPFLECSGLDHS